MNALRITSPPGSSDRRACCTPHYCFHSHIQLLGILFGLIASSVLARSVPVRAQANSREPQAPVARAVRVAVAPTVNGLLNEEVWRQATPIGPFTQTEPEVGVPASEHTEVRIVYTPAALYFAFRCEDARAGELRPKQMRWDGDLEGDDRIEIILDTFGDRRSAYSFAFTPTGAQRDAQVREEGAGINLAWDGVWYVATRIGAGEWTAEVAIPFSTLRFHSAEVQVWGFNIERVLRRRNEYAYWAPQERGLGSTEAEGKYRLAYAGILTGLSGIRPGSRLELKPFGLASQAGVRQNGNAGNWHGTCETGLDARFAFGSGYSLDATLNTDFAQVEADQEQIQIDRFPLFYPEKREFFIENHDLFSFGLGEYNAPPPFQLFYSRRIGLATAPDGVNFELPIAGGLRLTGKNGPWSVGALAVRTGRADHLLPWSYFEYGEPPGYDETYHLPTASMGVVRVSRDILTRSRIGLLVAGRDWTSLETWHPLPERYLTGGVDASFSLFRNTQITTFLAGSRRGDGKTAPAASLNYSWNTDLWGVNLINLYVDKNWADDLGFVRRTGTLRNTAEFSWSPRPRLPGIRQTVFFADTDFYTRPDGRLESRSISPGVSARLSSGGAVVLGLENRYEFLETEFVLGEVHFPAGWYTWSDAFFFVSTNASRAFGTELTLAGGPYYSGNRRTAFGTLWWQPDPRWRAEVNVFWNRIRAAAPTTPPEPADIRRYQGRVLATRLTWTPSVTTLLKLFTQVNTVTDVGNVNLLLAWRYRPRSWLYLVWNDGLERDGFSGKWRSTGRILMLKLTYLWNL
jgi:hypothetical protein